MADAAGVRSKMGIKEVAGWTSAYATPDIAVPLVSENISQQFERIESDSLYGNGARQPSIKGNEQVQGETIHELDYNNYDSIFKAIFGAEASRVFTISDDDLPEYRYLEFEKDIERWRYGPAKVTKIVISGQSSGSQGIIRLAVTWLVKTRVRTGTAFPAITPATRNLVAFKHMTFRIADLVDAVGGGDEYGINSFEFELDRNLKGDDYDSESANQILVPIPDGFRVPVGLKLGVPRYNSTNKQLIDWRDADTPLQATVNFVSGSEQFLIELPNLRLEEGFEANVGGPGVIPLDGMAKGYPSEAGNPMYVGNEARITFV